MRREKRSCVTLVELMVVILLLGLLSGVVGLTMESTPRVSSLDATTVAVLQARDSALRTGHPVTIAISHQRSAYRATACPDGRVITDVTVGIDPLSGNSVRDATPPTNVPTQGGASHGER